MRKTTALMVLVLLALVVRADLSLAAKKWALVIGNAGYKEAPLRCPVNDSNDVAETLGNLGFTVAKLTDANQQEMENAIRSLGQRVKADDTALFYFSGHGLQVGGVNYLVPIGMEAHSEDEVKYKGVPAEMVLDKLETAGSRMNIIILDACRSNPFRRYRSVGTGLAQMNSPAGTLIAYATAPGTVALDGTGRNSPYTKHLIGNMRRPGVEIGMAFRQVRVGVMRETKDRQVPWESSSLTGTFHFAAVGDAAYYNNRGRAWHYRGDLEKAMAEFDQAIRVDPHFASAYSSRGVLWQHKGDFAKAIDDFNQAIRLDPNLAKAYNNRALVWARKGDTDRALSDYDQAIQLDPGWAGHYSNRANLWYEQGEYDKAIEDCSTAIQIDPRFPAAYCNRGLAWKQKGDYARAIDDHSEAIRLQPRDGWTHDRLAAIYATCPDPKYRDGQKAVKHATTACELDGWKSHLKIRTLAAAYAEAGDFKKAVEWQAKALGMAPKEDRASYQSRLDLYKAGKPYREELKR